MHNSVADDGHINDANGIELVAQGVHPAVNGGADKTQALQRSNQWIFITGFGLVSVFCLVAIGTSTGAMVLTTNQKSTLEGFHGK